LIGGFLFLIIVKNNIMISNLQELIDNNKVSEMEIVEFLCTLKKLSENNILGAQDFQLVLDHFGFKEKKGWIKFGNGSKYKLGV